MTTEQLRQYIPLKKEQRQIEQRLRALENRPESDSESLRPLRECYVSKLEELVTAQLAIEKAIEALTPTERELIRLRYIDGLDWHRVAAGINYSDTQNSRLHARAVRKLKKL